jgi:imidazolonepropionase-like amidohydrolase
MVEKNIALTPTFTVFRNYGAPLDGMRENLRRFSALGGIIALGNDYGGGPGDFEMGIPFFELEQMQQSGMTPMQIIVASTKNAALVSNIRNEVGTVEVGKIADLLIVTGDPLQELSVLKEVRMVIHNGQIIRDTP